jgi:hypothetical protein
VDALGDDSGGLVLADVDFAAGEAEGHHGGHTAR